MTLATKWKFCSICFLPFICENTHKKFGIKIFEIDMLMIFDLLTLTQGHRFDPRMKMLLAFCSARHPRRFDMPHDHVWKHFFDPLGTPSAWKSHPKSCLICFVSFICENTHKVWNKNLWNWLCNWNQMIFDLLTPPQGPRGRGQNFF